MASAASMRMVGFKAPAWVHGLNIAWLEQGRVEALVEDKLVSWHGMARCQSWHGHGDLGAEVVGVLCGWLVPCVVGCGPVGSSSMAR